MALLGLFLMIESLMLAIVITSGALVCELGVLVTIGRKFSWPVWTALHGLLRSNT